MGPTHRDPSVEERVDFYVKMLQEAVRASGYGVVSKSTLLKVVKQYVATYKPPEAPGDTWTAAPVVPQALNREKLVDEMSSFNFKDYAQRNTPQTQSLPSNVVDLFKKK